MAKSSPFYKKHQQCHFHEWKFVYTCSKFTAIYYQWANNPALFQIMARRQAGASHLNHCWPSYWRLHASSSPDEQKTSYVADELRSPQESYICFGSHHLLYKILPNIASPQSNIAHTADTITDTVLKYGSQTGSQHQLFPPLWQCWCNIKDLKFKSPFRN